MKTASEQLQNIVGALESAVTQSGARLVDLCEASPVLLVFLRHAGCTFCREALADLSQEKKTIDATGTRIVLVHMGDGAAIEKLLERYKLQGVDRISDPTQSLYQAFGLKRGNLRQLLGPRVLWRAFGRGVLARHGIGWQAADASQMPGLFLMDDTGIIRRFRHKTAADRPDYAAMASEAVTTAAVR